MQYWSLVDTAKFFDRLWGRVEAEAPHDVAKVGEVKLCRAVEVEEKIPLDQVISNGPGFYKKTNIVIIFYGT